MPPLNADNEQDLTLIAPEGVFAPTGTTKVLVEAVSSYIDKPGKLLDLGCGSGAVGLELCQRDVVELPLYASDISQNAVDCVKTNAQANNYSVVAKCGPLFEPWADQQFDYIVDDVAGIAHEAAQISPWYNNVPCESGVDGTLLINQIIQQAKQHLTPKGLFFFPVISLSNVGNILTTAKTHFTHVEQLSHTQWPLPKEMYAHADTLKKLQDEGHIELIEKFGMMLYFTDIYVGLIGE